MLHTKDSLQLKDTCRLRVKIQSNSNQKNAGATLIRQNRLQAKNGEKKQIRSLYNDKESVYQEDITIVNISVPNIIAPQYIKQTLMKLRGFPAVSDGIESACNVGVPGFDPWVGKIPWRRAWQPTPVFLPGEFHGQRSLAGYGPQGHRRLCMTETEGTQHALQN